MHSDTYPAISPVTSNPSNKTVFITGASKGIGRAITISFARAGASRIAIGARSDLSDVVKDIQIAALEAERKTPQILAVSLDVSDVKSVASAAKEVETVFGELDIVISNAGILVAATIADSNPEDWWNSWAVNLYGSYLIAKGFMPLLLKKKDGDKTFITISSVGAHLTILGLSAYQTSKLAQLRLMEFICAEYANQDVLAYSIHPGNIPGTDIMGPAGVPNHLKHGELFCMTFPQVEARGRARGRESGVGRFSGNFMTDNIGSLCRYA